MKPYSRIQFGVRQVLAVTVAVAGMLWCLPPRASAAQFELIYTGAFSTADAFNLASAATPTNFTDTTPFTARAIFDDTSPNLVAPIGIPGFVAYAPLLATLTFGGTTYTVTGFNENSLSGISVSIFDQNTPFNPGRYGIGWIQAPLQDGAGFVGDWLSASPAFTAGNLTATTFVGYQGAGFLSGIEGAVTPLVLRNNLDQIYALTLASRIEEFSDGAPLHTAVLQQVPEPGTLGVGGAAVALLLLVERRRSRARREVR